MFNKKRIVIFVGFLCCLFFMTTFAGAPAQNTIIATRSVEFVDGYNNRTISEQTIEVGTDAEVPSDPEHDGYIFAGWYLFDDQDVRVTDFTNVLNDLKVIAKYQGDANRNGIADENEPRYTVTFIDSFDGRILATEEVLTGMQASAPTVPTHDGYTFTGWDRSYSNVTGNITVRTVYTTIASTTPTPEEPEVNYYNVVFIDTLTNRVITTERIAEGLTASTPTIPTHDGYLFVRWNGDFTNVNSDREIYTVYVRDENNNGVDDTTETRYSITFDAKENGLIVLEDGTTRNTLTINNILTGTEFGTAISKLPKILANENYIANGWNETIPTEDFLIEENMTFTAKYLEDKNNNGAADDEETLLIVTFYDTIENKILKTEEVLPGLSATAPTPNKYDRKLFTGWDKEFTNITVDTMVNTIYVDDVNNNGIDDSKEQETKKTLTIEYVSVIPETDPVEYNTILTSKTVELLPGQTETYLAPTRVIGYTLDENQESSITITMPNEDTTIRFIYKPIEDKNNNGIDDTYEENTKVTLSFEYVSWNKNTNTYNTLTPDTPLENLRLLPGESYEVTAPTITNYIVNGTSQTAKGIMGNEDKTIKFVYRPVGDDKNNDGIADVDQNLHTLTINHIGYTTDGNETTLKTEKVEYLLENSTYEVKTKSYIEYIFDDEKTKDLNVTMPNNDYTFNVYYKGIEKEVKLNYNIVENNQIINKSETKMILIGSTLENKLDLSDITKSYEFEGYKYAFNGWKINDIKITNEELNKLHIESNIELYADYTKTPLNYKLTINYNFIENPNNLDDKYEDTISYGEEYSVTSPVIDGYVATPKIVSGVMDTKDIIVDVNYLPTKPILNVNKEDGYSTKINLEIIAEAFTNDEEYKDNKIEKYYINGIEINTTTYEITENGEYIIKVEDSFGQTNETIVTINKIDNQAPIIDIAGDDNNPKYKPAIHIDGNDEHNYLDIQYNIDEDNIEKIEYARGNFKDVEEYKNNAQNITNITNSNGTIRVTVDGYYTMYVLDKAGNETIKNIHISGIKENKWYSFAVANLKTEDKNVNIYLSTTYELNPRLRTIEITTKENVNLLNVKYEKSNDKLDISYFKNKGTDTISKFDIEGIKDDVFSIYIKYEENGNIKEDIVYTKLWVD